MGQKLAEGYFLGIDVGTQGTKTIILDGSNGEVIASERAEYPLIEKADGTREQNSEDWVKAVKETVRSVLNISGINASGVKGVGVSGQQHGFVPLDSKNRVIRNAKLWNDTTTGEQCKTLINRLGGLKKVLALTGNNILPGYTAPKVLWLKEKEPENYKRLSYILLPHDYINFYLTGEKKAEQGDASGTAFFKVREREWSEEVLSAIDDQKNLLGCLPPLINSVEPAGFLRKEVLEDFGLPTGLKVVVSSGGGDNMMGAIGTGNTRKGVVTVSLGTSGTVYAYSDFPVVDSKGEFAAFCDSTGGWLPLACTMNVTVATELVKKLFTLNNEDLEKLVNSIAPGSGGLILLPYFVGERTPNIPSGTGVYFGINEFTFKQAFIARSAMEGVTLGLKYGLEGMKQEGISPAEIRLTGGGSKSEVWQQIAADIFGVPTVTMKFDEGASYGAALQAMWCFANLNGQKISISDITDNLVLINEQNRKMPRLEVVEIYKNLYALQNRVSSALREAFEQHRSIITGLLELDT